MWDVLCCGMPCAAGCHTKQRARCGAGMAPALALSMPERADMAVNRQTQGAGRRGAGFGPQARCHMPRQRSWCLPRPGLPCAGRASTLPAVTDEVLSLVNCCNSIGVAQGSERAGTAASQVLVSPASPRPAQPQGDPVPGPLPACRTRASSCSREGGSRAPAMGGGGVGAPGGNNAPPRAQLLLWAAKVTELPQGQGWGWEHGKRDREEEGGDGGTVGRHGDRTEVRQG